MHFRLYVCLPKGRARSSKKARERVAEYLVDEGFIHHGRFCGHADYFSIGGRWSGSLTLLRLRHTDPDAFQTFWLEYTNRDRPQDPVKLFGKYFPGFDGEIPIAREKKEFHGFEDDAQIMDDALFTQLRTGFSEKIDYSWDLNEKPNVICTRDDADFKWPKNAKSATRYWVVIVDYHD